MRTAPRVDSESQATAIALQRSEERLMLMIDAVPAMISYLDANERYLFCNKPYRELLGMTNDEILGRTLTDVLGPEYRATIQKNIEEVLAGKRTSYERMHKMADGSIAEIEVTWLPHANADAVVVGFFALTLDITVRKRQERALLETQAKLREMAQHDSLTGLPNRALFEDRLGHALARSKRYGETFAVLYLDIDRFKTINDSRGHGVGDELLKGFATRLAACVRRSDTVARLGGDEFVVILENLLKADYAATVAQKIISAMHVAFDLSGDSILITTSIGIAISSAGAMDATTLVAQADAALYDAKRKGRNTYCMASAT